VLNHYATKKFVDEGIGKGKIEVMEEVEKKVGVV
jgi:hypothetical protein